MSDADAVNDAKNSGSRGSGSAGASDSENGSGGSDDQREMLGAVEPGADSAIKDPETWVTGDEPMTAPQKSYLDTLAREAGEEIPADLTKAKASEEIERLQQATGRSRS